MMSIKSRHFRRPFNVIHLLQPFQMQFLYSYAIADKISTDIARRAVPLRQMSFLYVQRRIHKWGDGDESPPLCGQENSKQMYCTPLFVVKILNAVLYVNVNINIRSLVSTSEFSSLYLGTSRPMIKLEHMSTAVSVTPLQSRVTLLMQYSN